LPLAPCLSSYPDPVTEPPVASVQPLPDMSAEIGFSLWTLEETRRRTLRYIDGITQEALDHRPEGHRHSVATLLYHIAVFEVDWLYTDILGMAEDEERGIPGCPEDIAALLPYPMLLPGHEYTPVSGEALATHIERMAFVRRRFVSVVGAMTVEDFRKPRPSGDELVTPEWVVEHLSQHEAEHRGQIWEARVAAERALGA
jgi:uncharacterized damage-inducible protein DinB